MEDLQQEVKRVHELDDWQAGQELKLRLAAQQRQTELARTRQQLAGEAQVWAAQHVIAELARIVEDAGLPAADAARLNPASFSSLAAWRAAVAKALSTPRAASKAPAAPTAPQKSAPPSPDAFFKEFAGGKASDMKQAKALLKGLGLSF